MSSWYNRINGTKTQTPLQQNSGMQFQNPIQKANYILETLRNPAAFVKQQFPDIPENIQNNPDDILRYLQRTRGISDQQIQQLSGMCGRR